MLTRQKKEGLIDLKAKVRLKGLAVFSLFPSFSPQGKIRTQIEKKMYVVINLTFFFLQWTPKD